MLEVVVELIRTNRSLPLRHQDIAGEVNALDRAHSQQIFRLGLLLVGVRMVEGKENNRVVRLQLQQTARFILLLPQIKPVNQRGDAGRFCRFEFPGLLAGRRYVYRIPKLRRLVGLFHSRLHGFDFFRRLGNGQVRSFDNLLSHPGISQRKNGFRIKLAAVRIGHFSVVRRDKHFPAHGEPDDHSSPVPGRDLVHIGRQGRGRLLHRDALPQVRYRRVTAPARVAEFLWSAIEPYHRAAAGELVCADRHRQPVGEYKDMLPAAQPMADYRCAVDVQVLPCKYLGLVGLCRPRDMAIRCGQQNQNVQQLPWHYCSYNLVVCQV